MIPAPLFFTNTPSMDRFGDVVLAAPPGPISAYPSVDDKIAIDLQSIVTDRLASAFAAVVRNLIEWPAYGFVQRARS